MQQIDLHNIKAIFFDRGNVTHECRLGPSSEERDHIIALKILKALSERTDIQTNASDIFNHLISPWRASFALRHKNGYENSLIPFVQTFIKHLGQTDDHHAIEIITTELSEGFIQWDSARSDVLPLFQYLHDSAKKIGIVASTTVPDNFYIKQYELSGIAPLIDIYALSYSLGCRKPNPEILLKTCKSLDLQPSECILVGDKLEIDIVCAKAAGSKSIWYKQEEADLKDEYRPDYIIESLTEMYERIAT